MHFYVLNPKDSALLPQPVPLAISPSLSSSLSVSLPLAFCVCVPGTEPIFIFPIAASFC